MQVVAGHLVKIEIVDKIGVSFVPKIVANDNNVVHLVVKVVDVVVILFLIFLRCWFGDKIVDFALIGGVFVNVASFGEFLFVRLWVLLVL